MNKTKRITTGEYAWITMAFAIATYDIIAIKTKKAETMSTALWQALQDPFKLPLTVLSWSVLIHHLFLSKNARDSVKELRKKI